MINEYEDEVAYLTTERDRLEAKAIIEEAEVSRIRKQVDDIMRALDPRTDENVRQMIARSVGITFGGAEGMRELQEELGDLHEPLAEHQSRAKALRSRIAAIDRRIGEYEAAIERLRQTRNR